MWLRKLRDAPPTDDEMARYARISCGRGCSFSGFIRAEWEGFGTALQQKGSSKDALCMNAISDEFPSPILDLCCRGEAKANEMKAKVEAIDEQERLRRLRMQSMGMQVINSYFEQIVVLQFL